jgi:hypothetical protein
MKCRLARAIGYILAWTGVSGLKTERLKLFSSHIRALY